MTSLKEFISLLDRDQIFDSREKLLDLSRSLDELACFANQKTEFASGNFVSQPPEMDSERNYQRFKKKFPSLGYYNCVENVTEKIADTKVIVGDAIDDLADIYKDVKETLWLFENATIDEGHFHLKWSYDNHWGSHLRNLQLVLFTAISGFNAQ